MAAYNLEEILNTTKYESSHCGLGIIGSIGRLLEPNTRLFIYPAVDEENSVIQTTESIETNDEMTFLLMYLKVYKIIVLGFSSIA